MKICINSLGDKSQLLMTFVRRQWCQMWRNYFHDLLWSCCSKLRKRSHDDSQIKKKINRNVCKVRGKHWTRHREAKTKAYSSKKKKWLPNNNSEANNARWRQIRCSKVKLNKNAIKMHSICCSEKRGGCCCLTLGIIKTIPPPPTFCVCDTNESESVEIFMHKKKR